jgi:hypothetical protein
MRGIIDTVLAVAALLAAIAPALADSQSPADCLRESELASVADTFRSLLENFELRDKETGGTFEAEQNKYLARFDAEKALTLSGAVKEFRWSNPRAGIVLDVPNGEARPATWAIEMIGPSGLVRLGWRPTTLTPGMLISLTIHPLRDGSNGGQLMTATLPDGKQMDGGRPFTMQDRRDQVAAADRALAEFRQRSSCGR